MTLNYCLVEEFNLRQNSFMKNFERTMKRFTLTSENNKKNLWKLCISRGESVDKQFEFNNLNFYFDVKNRNEIEDMYLYICIPKEMVCASEVLPLHSYLILKSLYKLTLNYSNSIQNPQKNFSENAAVSIQYCDNRVTRMNGCYYSCEKQKFILKVSYRFALKNGTWIDVKSNIRHIKKYLNIVYENLNSFDKLNLAKYISTYVKQQEIRTYLQENNYCAFIADGSILPRRDGTDDKLEEAIPFLSPDTLRITIRFSDNSEISGMAIKNGVTVITGGGYSGKSTLLDAIEEGIYNHIYGDGREFVISDATALKIYSEDGRPVQNLNIAPFFSFLPGKNDIYNFSTSHASGSVSQAANVIEAVCGESKLLLLDEDKSATNFMIRDKNMRVVVKNEPIIPFTDRVKELHLRENISTILVIGGSSEFLLYADTVILMDKYLPKDITKEIESLNISAFISNESEAEWTHKRYLYQKEIMQPFLYFKNIETENQKKIILDNYYADITLLTAIKSNNQLNTLAYVMEQLLTDKETDSGELLQKSYLIIERLFNDGEILSLIPALAQRFYEEIRPIDAFCCINRMRGVCFKNTV